MLLTLFQAGAQQFYWERPEILVEDDASFIRSANGEPVSAVLWHDFGEPAKDGSRSLYISMLVRSDGWKSHERVLGPFDYVGEKVPVASLAVNGRGHIFIALAVSGNNIGLYRSVDLGESFNLLAQPGLADKSVTTVAPRLSISSDGSLLLFVTQPLLSGSGQSLTVQTSLGSAYSVSRDGFTWSDFRPLVQNPLISYVYLPSHVAYGGSDYVVFQASPSESRFYQLYLVRSDDGGSSWSPPLRLTDFADTSIADNPDPDVYDNQRPNLFADDAGIHLAWERRYAGSSPPQVFYALLNEDGDFSSEAELITRGSNISRNPVVTAVGGEPVLFWYDDRKGENRIFFAARQALGWQEQDVSIMDGVSAFPVYIKQDGELYLLWENTFRGRSRIAFLEPDRAAPAPRISPLDFRAGRASGQDSYSISWNLPDDSSGIAGFSYSLDRTPDGAPPRRLMVLRPDDRRFRTTIPEDGSWYFHVAARDYAGNWSDPSTVEVIRDTTPPSRVSFRVPEADENGFLPSNTGSIVWNEPPEDDVAGYTYRLQYLTGTGFEGDPEELRVVSPPGGIRVEEPGLDFRNIDNGVWGISVAAVDKVGNTGEPAVLRFKVNKYIPVTFINNLAMNEDELGRYLVSIRGRGFSVGGTVGEVLIDRDRREPWDYRFGIESGAYRVLNDRLIDGPVIEDIDGGTYYLGVVHPVRGTYFSAVPLSFTDSGTVKFGDFTILEGPAPVLRRLRHIALSGGQVSFVLIMTLLAFGLLFSLYRLMRLVREGSYIRSEAIALLESRQMPHEEQKERIETMAKERKGLQKKFILLVTFLVLLIVLLVSLPLGRFMIHTQQRNLADGLQQSTRVLVESLASGAGKFLPEENTIELGRLPAQSQAAEDALYATITGFGTSQVSGLEDDYYDYLWATNDPDIADKLTGSADDAPGEVGFRRGAARFEDLVSPEIDALRSRINRRAEEEVGALSRELLQLQDEARTAAGRLVARRNEDVAQLLQELQDAIADINSEIEAKLQRIGAEVSSVPDFDQETILTGPSEYVFYRPIVYQDSSRPGVYYHGLIRLGITTERIRGEIITSRDELVRRTAIIALGAILIGIIGAMILAAIILIPIKQLVAGVELISETEDKEKLKDHVIKIKGRDELFQLAETINEMTKGLVKAEAARKDLTIGKEVQKMFIPLEVDSRGNKKTTASNQYSGLNLFGYYEGAKGVSGDYFDYMELPGNLYAIIKCDIAGKGVPASLIMVEVATIFRNFLNEWKRGQERAAAIARSKNITPRKQEPAISQLVSSINSLVQERGFQGRFAALIVVLIDADSGKTTFCHAGDNQVHIYDGEKSSMIIKTLPQAPAAGVFDNDMVDMQGGFPAIPHMFRMKDRLFLFTDGIEEAQRRFRDSRFEVISCNEPGLEQGELHDTHPVGNDNEELGIPRIQDIVNTFYRKEIYRLEKYHNPVPDELLEFNFSTCSDTIEEAVLALIAVEKVFRLNPDPTAGEGDLVHVDLKIDAFLREHFLQYSQYFENRESSRTDVFVAYHSIKEDEQYDDLTILGVERV
jgi:serine phosphatase RsbU (regulator of sigma subunit)